MPTVGFMWWGRKCFIVNVKSSYGMERYSLIGLYIIRILINLIKGLIMLFLSPEPLPKSQGELQKESLQDKVQAWESIKESFILESRHTASVFITVSKLDIYKEFSGYQTHHSPYTRSYWLYLNCSYSVTKAYQSEGVLFHLTCVWVRLLEVIVQLL